MNKRNRIRIKKKASSSTSETPHYAQLQKMQVLAYDADEWEARFGKRLRGRMLANFEANDSSDVVIGAQKKNATHHPDIRCN